MFTFIHNFRIAMQHPIPKIVLRLFALLALVWLFAAPLAGPGAAQAPRWSDPVSMGPGWFPDITADQAGNVHLAWSASVAKPNPDDPTGRSVIGYDQVMYAVESGGQWSKPIDIVALKMNGGSEVTRPTLLADPQGILHMTYRGVFVYYSNAPVSMAGLATNWAPPYRFSEDQVSYFSRMAMDSKGTLHLVYTENVMTAACTVCYHVYYRQSTNGGATWSLRQDISVLPTGAAKPQILVDHLGNLHVVWEAGEGGAYGQLSDPTTAFYTSSRDNGVTWSHPVEIAVPNGQAKDITIGEDGQGNIVVAWLALPDDVVSYQVSADQGKTWEPAQAIPGIAGGWTVYPARLDDYTMATDEAGNIHLVLVGRQDQQQTSLDLLHLTWNGHDWSAPEVITSLLADVMEWPRLTINRGNELHIAYFVRSQATIWNSDHGVYDVRYTHTTLDLPAQDVVVWPTPTPVITASPTPIPPTQTPTPVDPTLGNTPVSPQLQADLYKESDELTVIGMSILPAAVVVILAVAFIKLKRR